MFTIGAGMAVAQEQPPSTTPPPDVANEYRITGFPSYRINETWSGFGYLGWVYKPDADYTCTTWARACLLPRSSGFTSGAASSASTRTARVKSDSLELRPFIGPKFLATNAEKWRYFNWTRYELRLTETLDTDEWKTVHRLRNQTRIEIPLAPIDRAWTPKSWYLLADVEPIYRSDSGRLTRCACAPGSATSPTGGCWWSSTTSSSTRGRMAGGLAYTDNIFRLNFKIALSRGDQPLAAAGRGG